ncbi:MAG: dienelactone hydrolase family protein [Bdellovibrionales bacterium]|nr:dienelactone hydrolase family protein [Bdellovibrionales bacterium]
MKLIAALVLTLFTISCSSGSKSNSMLSGEVLTEEVEYTIDGKKHLGFVAKPMNVDESTPAVLVVHEWWGQTDYPRRRAIMLAKLGYVAMATDMYGDRKILEHPKDAGKFAGQAMKDSKTVASRFTAAMETLKKVKGVNAEKIAAIGYCFGGGVVIDAAKQGLPLKAIVSFHGSLDTPTKAKKGEVKARLLVINGADDSFIKESSIQNFKSAMTKASADFKFVNLEGALHGFSNPDATLNGKKFGIPLAYNEQADQQSWQMMQEFLAESFK